MNQCALYIATGDEYISQAIKSAKSLKRNTEGIDIILFSDKDLNVGVFDKVRLLENPNYDYSDSIPRGEMITKLQYDQILFLDTDTYITENLSDLFNILDEFDIGLRPISASIEISDGLNQRSLPTLDDSDKDRAPKPFPEFNTGVIVMKNNEEVRRFLSDWRHLYNSNSEDQKLNQASFREVLYRSSLRIAPLATEYNCRLSRPGFQTGRVYIAHGHHPEIEKAAAKINETHKSRLVQLKSWPIYVDIATESLFYKLNHSVRSQGIYPSVKSKFKNLTSSIKEDGIIKTGQKIRRMYKNN